jgi:hypothetical protein
MRLLLFAIASVLAFAPAPARAFLVAGWDFSQYFGDGILSVDGVGYTTRLSANYSSLDPTFNAGFESALYGTMYVDGSNGSSAVDPEDPVLPAFAPTAGSLASNLDAPVFEPGDNAFDSDTILIDEGGQLFANLQSMIASQPVSVVFEADLRSAGESQGNWELSFGGRASSGTSMVGIGVSTDGGSFGLVDSVNLTDADTRYVVSLTPTVAERIFVRLDFHPQDLDWPIVDNVAISAPEADATAPLAAAALTLLAWRRAR